MHPMCAPHSQHRWQPVIPRLDGLVKWSEHCSPSRPRLRNLPSERGMAEESTIRAGHGEFIPLRLPTSRVHPAHHDAWQVNAYRQALFPSYCNVPAPSYPACRPGYDHMMAYLQNCIPVPAIDNSVQPRPGLGPSALCLAGPHLSFTECVIRHTGIQPGKRPRGRWCRCRALHVRGDGAGGCYGGVGV